ncbi:MAG: 30S ribosomal protein S8 [Desulfobulbaceae bacterium]|nr:30S ribosomal protein S8 [Desulfobulbaceae bacterium]MCK5322644.1 30S ribosomal protein S8 [Desulfobulbaceae bacterium]MCK5544230.1 30S ribosomal protein S8 [Desulfobulbaceae bacterium]
MSMSDPMADMLTRIRNAGMAKFVSLEMPTSKMKVGVARILKDEGYITDFQVKSSKVQGVLKIDLKYDQHNRKAITGLRRVSKPGRRVYVKYDKIPKVMSGLGIGIISSSKGIITGKQAQSMGIGGELLCEIW